MRDGCGVCFVIFVVGIIVANEIGGVTIALRDVATALRNRRSHD